MTYQHPQFTREDWQHEAGNGDTYLGYLEWLAHKVESAKDDGELELYNFHVSWETECFNCEGPVDAVRCAATQRFEAGNRVFIVTDDSGNKFRVDLSESEPEAREITS